MIMILTIFIVLAAIVATVLLTRKFSKNDDVESADAFLKEDVTPLPMKEPVTPSPAVENIEKKIAIVTETAEDLKKRLNDIVNPDIDKPFANLSKSDIAEVPTAPVKDLVEFPEVEAKNEAKKKRTYKKRSPKTEN